MKRPLKGFDTYYVIECTRREGRGTEEERDGGNVLAVWYSMKGATDFVKKARLADADGMYEIAKAIWVV